ncbi:ABC transporter permease [Cognatiluteimonas weifangensis]|uniref:ABC transporter permease n=1 Tax=Cognatiluteimonas weifangensis TaxID=2303539 RepID=A0A372DPX3_9GAMM|nr:ABC transporter permease [Luteimonas weifangensis]RFP61427.1 ABC transporter permease [Luteimonas weifangensis]
MKALWIVWKKELRELLRDRRTLALTLLLGPLLGPLLFLGMATIGESKAKEQMEKPLAIAIVGAEHAPNLVAWLAGQGITHKQVADPDAAIRAQDEDVYLRIGDDYASHWREGTPALVEIVHDSTRQDAEIPAKRLETVLGLYSQQVGALRLLARGVNPGVAAPLTVSRKDLSTPEARGATLAAMLLPYLLILGAFIGSLQLVLDTTAGERERQSLEPLLATPARRGAIVSGKIAAACSVGVVALVLTLLAFRVGAAFAPGIAKQLAMGGREMAVMLLVLLPMVFLGGSLLTFIAAGAKSVKEAQSYTGILILLPIVPTVVLMVSPVKNQLWMFAVPFLAQNQMLLKVIREEAIAPQQWLVYLAAGLGLAAALWYAAIRRYHQEKLAVSA